jgi:hypothetical protein
MTDLSPAAQEVLHSFWDAPVSPARNCQIAAALRAAADEVAPMAYEGVWTDGKMLQYEKQDPVRDKLLAIAAELDNTNNTSEGD